MPNIIYDAGTPGFNNGLSNSGGPLAVKGLANAQFVVSDPRVRDVSGRLKVSQHQNIYDADFEYGLQPQRWESLVVGSATITHLPGLGGVQMQVSAAGDVAIRQSRPYQRYQPGKALYVASNVNFGGALAGQVQRVGIFDDGNGIFFEQAESNTANPSGMFVVVRSDSQGTTGGLPIDTRIPITSWNGDQSLIKTLDWTRVQMIWMEYAWYGAGALRFGVLLNGEPYIVHQIGVANSAFTGLAQQLPWSRTGNLPVRYEMRNTFAATLTTFRHFGVSVLLEGSNDPQRGFTYSYGMNLSNPTVGVTAPKVRQPIMSFRMRPMGQITVAGGNTITASSTIHMTGTAAGNAQYPGRYVTYRALIGTAVSTVTTGTSSITGTTTTSSNILTVTAGSGVVVGSNISAGTTTPANLIILSQLSGTTGGVGTYLLGAPASAGGTATATTGGVYTIAFTNAHNLIVGDVITLSGFTSPAGINGVFPVLSVVDSLNVTINAGFGVTGAVTVGSGIVTCQYTARIVRSVVNNSTFSDPVRGFAQFTTDTTTGTTLNVTSVQSGQLVSGMTLAATTTAIATISAQLTGTPGGAGTYTISSSWTGGAGTAYGVFPLPNPPQTATVGVYQIGLVDRGQLLPQTLLISSTSSCIVELIASTPTNPVGLSGASFVPLTQLGSPNSFAERDVSATALSGGEVVYSFTSPTAGLQQLDLTNFFPVLTNIRGNIPDILTVAVTAQTNVTGVGVNLVCQEAMS
jgi:hypothetical protein